LTVGDPFLTWYMAEMKLGHIAGIPRAVIKHNLGKPRIPPELTFFALNEKLKPRFIILLLMNLNVSTSVVVDPSCQILTTRKAIS
jgi:hypothetical protein